MGRPSLDPSPLSVASGSIVATGDGDDQRHAFLQERVEVEEVEEGGSSASAPVMAASSPRMAALKRTALLPRAPSLSSMGRSSSMFRHRMSLDMRKSASWHNESDADILAPSGAIPIR